MSRELSTQAERLLIPTNPNVNPDHDPTRVEGGEVEWVNPVAANNRVVLYANAVIEGTDQLAKLIRKQRAAKLAKRKAERALEKFEQRLLRLHPAPKGTSSLKALSAYIQKVAFEQDDTGTQYDVLVHVLEEAEDALTTVDAQVSETRMWLDAIEAAQEAIRTHLSWVKADANGSRRGR